MKARTETTAEVSLRRLVVAAFVLPVLVFIAASFLSYGSHLAAAQGRLARSVDTVHEHATKVFETLELVGGQVDLLLSGLSDEEVHSRGPDLHARIGALADRLDQVYSVKVLDARGRILVSSASTTALDGMDYSDWEYFRAFRDGLVPADHTYITELLPGVRHSDDAFFAVSIRRGGRTAAGPAGAPPASFSGVISISASPGYFTDFYQQFTRDDIDTVSVVRADGSMLARYPPLAASSRLSTASGFIMSVANAPERGTYETVSGVDGVRRLYAYRRLPGHPVYITTGLDRATVLAEWRSSIASHLMFGVPATGGLMLLAVVALHRSRREGQALASLAERTHELDRVWRINRDLCVVGDLDGFCRVVNPAWGDSLGYAPADVVGRRYDSFIHPEDVAEANRQFQTLAKGEAVRDVDLRMRAKDGSWRWYSWNCVPEGRTFHASGRDITDRRQLSEQLRQAQKMEAVGQLTGGIAHDFNNMLAIVIGSLDMLKRRLAGGETGHLRLVETSMEGATRAASLTQRLLAFSRRQALAPVPLDVNALVAGMSDLLQRTLTEGVRLETALAEGLWPTFADPNQLESAILNLAVNARDAMPGGHRKLSITTANSQLDEAYVREHFGVQAGPYVVVAVTDTGVGMSPEVAARAFEPFFTTKEVGKGTGLGLSMVYGFVKQSGGHVRIHSHPGHGTTVRLYLPRHRAAFDPAADARPGEGRPLPRRRSDGETVLVVEDEAAVRRVSAESLRELGYHVVEAADAAAALDALDQRPEVALLFTDVVMPEVNGVELAEAARRRRPALKVLFTTGYAGSAVVRDGAVNPGLHLLAKPFTLDQLASKVGDVMDEATPTVVGG